MRTAADYVEEHRITTVKNMANMLLYSIETMRTTFREADRLREDLENELRQGLDRECD